MKSHKFGDIFNRLMNNVFYGKTIENVPSRIEVEILNEPDRYINLAEKISTEKVLI